MKEVNRYGNIKVPISYKRQKNRGKRERKEPRGMFAGATLPVAAFFQPGIYGKVIWMIIVSIVLEIGHIGIYLQHRKEIN